MSNLAGEAARRGAGAKKRDFSGKAGRRGLRRRAAVLDRRFPQAAWTGLWTTRGWGYGHARAMRLSSGLRRKRPVDEVAMRCRRRARDGDAHGRGAARFPQLAWMALWTSSGSKYGNDALARMSSGGGQRLTSAAPCTEILRAKAEAYPAAAAPRKHFIRSPSRAGASTPPLRGCAQRKRKRGGVPAGKAGCSREKPCALTPPPSRRWCPASPVAFGPSPDPPLEGKGLDPAYALRSPARAITAAAKRAAEPGACAKNSDGSASSSSSSRGEPSASWMRSTRA